MRFDDEIVRAVKHLIAVDENTLKKPDAEINERDDKNVSQIVFLF